MINKALSVLIFSMIFQSFGYACEDAKGHDETMSCSATKTAKKTKSSLTIVKDVVSKYQKAKAVSIDVKKKVMLALLDDEKESTGQLILSAGRMRLEIKKPDPSLIVVNGNAIWVETPASPELTTKTQVLKIRSKEFSKQSKAPLALLLGQKKIWDEFKVKDEKTENEYLHVTLEPKTKGSLTEVTVLSIQVDPVKKLIRQLSYSDELGNETRFDFSNANFEAKVSATDLVYAPPADAEITEY